MSTQWIPNYIKRNIQYKPKDILTAQEYNAILNLLITQGDYNSSWLEYLQNSAIPEAIQDISADAIAAAIGEAVENEIAALTSAVTNKTSEYLDNPYISILNIGQGAQGILDLGALLLTKHKRGTFAVATNLIGQSQSYCTLSQLNELKAAGHTIVAYSTDGATVTAANAATVASTAKHFMEINHFNTDTFVYPNGLGDLPADYAIRDIVNGYFRYGVNEQYETVIEPNYYPANAGTEWLHDLPVILWDNTVDEDVMKEYIDDIAEYNQYMIIQVNTDLSTYDAEAFGDILSYVNTKSSMLNTNISAAMDAIFNTIGNKLALLNGIYITHNDNDELCLNW